MGLVEIVVLAVGLSMDAFAAALCQGLCMKKLSLKHAAVIALFFGGFQALMPLIGFLLGRQFAAYIREIDHWLAFALLAFLGGKMLYEGLKKSEASEVCEPFSVKRVLALAIATSIDALAAGVTFAFLKTDIVPTALLIGSITFGFSFAGVAIGNRFGAGLANKADILGGATLILIGLKILLEHLGMLA
ncbi:MAG: manganese efflux pump MntP family protein [Clostridiaceae bacterium]|nr:manganese efflux pump MntP family protein [Eubacteriales bacterium]